MKKSLVAVSGGVDSVVLLDFLVKKLGADNLVVAHFEHGIRGLESEQDLEFVRNLAKKYGVRFEFERGNLGKNASEEQARNARYNFLRKLSKKYDNAKIFTAHHKNDLAETFALNLKRGGGWRAIACLDSSDIERPFIGFSKQEIIEMVKDYNLEWREDSTNLDEKYARNRIRLSIKFKPEDLQKIFELWEKQIAIKREIEAIIPEVLSKINSGGKFERRFFRESPDEVCYEMIREILRSESGEIPLNKQVYDFLGKVRTYKNGSKTQILGGIDVRFDRNAFWFENFIKK